MPAKRTIKRQQAADEVQREAIRELYRKVLMLQEEEKRRISRDLHDETGQIVVGLGASLNVMEKELKSGHIDKALSVINENRDLIQEISRKMKTMALNLRPPELDLLGLAAVLREYFSQCTKSSPIRIEFNENAKDVKLSENTEITLYRIVQEAIYNILKHSMATVVKVDLIFKAKNLLLIIEDNGKGFDIEEHRRRYDVTKMGLHGIKERVDILNGTFSVDSAPGKGTKLIIDLPMEILKYGD